MEAPLNDIIKKLICDRNLYKDKGKSTLDTIEVKGTGQPDTLLIGGRKYRIVSR